MPEGIDVGADVVQHPNEISLERHCIARHAEICSLCAFVTHMDRDNWPLKQLVCRHVIFNGETEIDDTLSHGHSLGFRG